MVMPASEKIKFEIKSNVDDKTVSTMIETAKENAEVRGKITEMFLQGIDREKFKQKLIEEALKDKELRDKIMLELIRKL